MPVFLRELTNGAAKGIHGKIKLLTGVNEQKKAERVALYGRRSFL